MKQKIEKEAERILLDGYGRYYRLAYSYVKNEHDALDIVQESAYKVIKGCNKVKSPEYLSTWIYRVVMNTAVDFLRGQRNQQVSLEEVEIPHKDLYQEDDPIVMLECLGEKERAVVILKVFERLKFDEIAQVTGENVNTVKARLYRALKKLKIELEPEMV